MASSKALLGRLLGPLVFRAAGAPLVLFSGRAKSIQALRAGLRGGAWKTKAYWADGKSGLD